MGMYSIGHGVRGSTARRETIATAVYIASTFFLEALVERYNRTNDCFREMLYTVELKSSKDTNFINLREKLDSSIIFRDV